jgi:hypothetical protein
LLQTCSLWSSLNGRKTENITKTRVEFVIKQSKLKWAVEMQFLLLMLEVCKGWAFMIFKFNFLRKILFFSYKFKKLFFSLFKFYNNFFSQFLIQPLLLILIFSWEVLKSVLFYFKENIKQKFHFELVNLQIYDLSF